MQHLKIQRYIKTSVQKCFLQLCFLIFLTIVDFHETFDRVDHQVLWEVLKNCDHNHHSETVQKIHMSSHPWGNPD